MLKIKVTLQGSKFSVVVIDVDTDCGIWYWGNFTTRQQARAAAMDWIINMFGEGQREYVK